MLRKSLAFILLLSVALFFFTALEARAQSPTLYSWRDTLSNSIGQVIPNATVIILSGTIGGTDAVNIGTMPGSPLATIYADPYGATPINQTTNPLNTSAGDGTFQFWAAAGYYVVQAYGPGILGSYTYGVQVGGGGGSGGGGNYQTVEANGSAQTQQPTLNLISGTDATVSCANNAGLMRTDCTIALSNSGGGTVTDVTGTSPITVATGTTTPVVACPLCTTASSSLTANQLIGGAGGQSMSVVNLSGAVTTTGGLATALSTNAVATANIQDSAVTLGKTNIAACNSSTNGLAPTSPGNGSLYLNGANPCAWSNPLGATGGIYAGDPAYGLPASGAYSCGAAWTNSSMTLTTDSTYDPPFTSAMASNSWLIFITNGPCQGNFGGTMGTVCGNGTISAFNNAHSITLSFTPSCICAGKYTATIVSCVAVWVPGDSATALNAAWAAATPFIGKCQTLILPAGVYQYNSIVTSSGKCGAATGLSTAIAAGGPSVVGQSMDGTIMIPGPTLDCTSCATGSIFAAPNAVSGFHAENFTIFGGGNATVTNGTGGGKYAFFCDFFVSDCQNIQVTDWGNNTSGFFGIAVGGTGQGTSYAANINLYNGGFYCALINNAVTVVQMSCFDPGGVTIEGADVNTYGSEFSQNQGVDATVLSTGVWNSFGDLFDSLASNNGAILNEGNILLSGDTLQCVSLVCLGNGSGGNAGSTYLLKTSVSSTATIIGGGVSGSKLYDLGGNTFGGGGTNTLTNIKFPVGLPSLQGTPTIASGFGTSPSIASGSSTASFTINVGTSNTGTGVLTMPKAFNGWSCQATDVTTTSTAVSTTKVAPTSTTSVTFQNYTDISGTGAWADSDILSVQCSPY